MKLELKNIKVAAFASEETHCYEASLWVDGVRVGRVANEGHGGPDMLWLTDGGSVMETMRKINAWLSESDRGVAYKQECIEQFGGDGLTYDLEAWCSEQVNRWLLVQDMRKVMKKSLLWVGDDGEVYQSGLKGGAAVTAGVRKGAENMWPDRKWIRTAEEAADAMGGGV